MSMKPAPQVVEEQDWLDHTTAFLKQRPLVWVPSLVAIIVVVFLVTKPFATTPPIGTDPTTPGRPLPNPDQHLHSLAVDPLRPGVIYLGSHYGLFTSADNGKSWPQARGALNQLMITSLVASSVSAGSLGIIGLSPSGSDFGQNGVYISHDGGVTLKRATDPPGLPHDLNRYLIAPGATARQWFVIYAGAGLYMTLDDGQTWKLLRAPHSQQEAQRAVWTPPGQAQTVWLGSSDGLDITHDGGATWTHALDGGVHAIMASAADPHTVMIAADDGVYRVTGDGAQLTRVSVVVSSGPFTTLAVSPRHPQVMYGLVGHEIWRSVDGGTNWTQQQSLRTTFPVPAIFIAQDDDNHVYAGSYSPAVAVESRDGGMTWQIIAS